MLTPQSEAAEVSLEREGGSLPEMSAAKWPENSSQSRMFNTVNVWFPACMFNTLVTNIHQELIWPRIDELYWKWKDVSVHRQNVDSRLG